MVTVNPTVDRQSVLVGMARRFIAPYTPLTPPALPADTVALGGAWGSAWTELGATIKGLEFQVKRTVKKLYIDEQSVPVALPSDTTQFMFGMELSEDNIDTMRYAYGGGVIVTTAATATAPGVSKLTISPELEYFSFGFEGKNKFGYWRRVMVPIVVSVADAKTIYTRSDKQRTYNVDFESLVEVDQVDIREMIAPATGP